MEKETNCLYKKLCMSVYPEQKMNEHRLNCSKDNSYWCPYYWFLHDRNIDSEISAIQPDTTDDSIRNENK